MNRSFSSPFAIIVVIAAFIGCSDIYALRWHSVTETNVLLSDILYLYICLIAAFLGFTYCILASFIAIHPNLLRNHKSDEDGDSIAPSSSSFHPVLAHFRRVSWLWFYITFGVFSVFLIIAVVPQTTIVGVKGGQVITGVWGLCNDVSSLILAPVFMWLPLHRLLSSNSSPTTSSRFRKYSLVSIALLVAVSISATDLYFPYGFRAKGGKLWLPSTIQLAFLFAPAGIILYLNSKPSPQSSSLSSSSPSSFLSTIPGDYQHLAFVLIWASLQDLVFNIGSMVVTLNFSSNDSDVTTESLLDRFDRIIFYFAYFQIFFSWLASVVAKGLRTDTNLLLFMYYCFDSCFFSLAVLSSASFSWQFWFLQFIRFMCDFLIFGFRHLGWLRKLKDEIFVSSKKNGNPLNVSLIDNNRRYEEMEASSAHRKKGAEQDGAEEEDDDDPEFQNYLLTHQADSKEMSEIGDVAQKQKEAVQEDGEVEQESEGSILNPLLARTALLHTTRVLSMALLFFAVLTDYFSPGAEWFVHKPKDFVHVLLPTLGRFAIQVVIQILTFWVLIKMSKHSKSKLKWNHFLWLPVRNNSSNASRAISPRIRIVFLTISACFAVSRGINFLLLDL